MIYQTKKLGEICGVYAGFGFPKSIQGKTIGEYPFFKVGDMNTDIKNPILKKANHYLDLQDIKENGYKVFPAGTIIFPKIGGAIATNKKRIMGLLGLYDNNVMGLIPSEDVLSEYLFHWMKLQDISRWSSGTSLPAIKKSFVENLEIPLPPIEEQNKIVARLEKLLAKVKEAKRLRAEADAAAQALLSAELHKIFEEGEALDWSEKSIFELIDRVISIHPKNEFESEFKYIDISSVHKGIGIKEYKMYSVGNAPSRARRPLKKGDTIFALTRPYLRNIAFVNKEYNDAVASTGFAVLRAKLDVVEPRYLFYIVSSNWFVEQILPFQKGATYPAINESVIWSQNILLPPLEEQKKIVARLDALSEKLQTLKEYQQTVKKDLDRLEQSILHQAFSGE